MGRAGEDLLDRLLEFAARIGKVVDSLPDTLLGRHVAGQLVRCGTSPAELRRGWRRGEPKRFCTQIEYLLEGAARDSMLVVIDRQGGAIAQGEAHRVGRRMSPVDEHHREVDPNDEIKHDPSKMNAYFAFAVLCFMFYLAF